MAGNKIIGLLLLGGATLFILKKNSGTDEKSQISSGGGSGFIIPSGFGTSEVTNPSSNSTPNIIINESSYNPPTDTKKETVAKSNTGGYTYLKEVSAGNYNIPIDSATGKPITVFTEGGAGYTPMFPTKKDITSSKYENASLISRVGGLIGSLF